MFQTVYRIPWKMNLDIRINEPQLFDPWSSQPKQLEIVDVSKPVVKQPSSATQRNRFCDNVSKQENEGQLSAFTFQLPNARQYLGVYPIAHKDILMVCYLDYIGNISHVLVDFYKIVVQTVPTTNTEICSPLISERDASMPEISVERIIQHKIQSNHSCGNTIGKVCPSTYSPDAFFVCFGDLTNYTTISFFECTVEKCHPIRRIEYRPDYEPTFENVFWIDTLTMIYSRVVGHDSNQLNLALFTTDTEKCFVDITFSLQDKHIHNADKCKMYDSIVFDMFRWNSKFHCLIRIKLECQIDPLHIQLYFLDVIILVAGKESKVVDISQPILFDTSEEHDNYYGIRPYWVGDDAGVRVYNELS